MKFEELLDPPVEVDAIWSSTRGDMCYGVIFNDEVQSRINEVSDLFFGATKRTKIILGQKVHILVGVL